MKFLYSTLLVALFSLSTTGAFAQHTPDTLRAVYHKGSVVMDGERLVKPKQIGPVLLRKNNKDVEMYYRKYKTNRDVAGVFGFIGGALVGYPLGGAIANQPLNTGMLGVGLGVVAVSLLFQNGSNQNLKQAINHFNGDTSKNMSLSPGIYQDQWGTGIALRVSF
jgi:hypothetical protein